MPYRQTVTYAAGTTGAQTSKNVDSAIVPFNASVAVIVGAGAIASFSLQYCFDDDQSPLFTDAQANWYTSTDIPAGTAANAQAAFVTPVTRVRLNIASLTGGSLTMIINQGLSTN